MYFIHLLRQKTIKIIMLFGTKKQKIAATTQPIDLLSTYGCLFTALKLRDKTGVDMLRSLTECPATALHVN